jgi:hypothetical protein
MSASEIRPDSRLLGSDGRRIGTFVTVSNAPALPSGRGELEQIQIPLGQMSVRTMERYLGCKQRIHNALDDRIGLEQSVTLFRQPPSFVLHSSGHRALRF